MNQAKCTEHDYINFLIATQKAYSASEAARTHPQTEDAPAHDAYTRLLQRLPPDSQALWEEVEPCIDKAFGLLVIDDSTLDKPYAKHMGLVTRHWSGKHKEVVQGINLITLVWTDGQQAFPCDFRIYTKEDGLTKNDHFRVMLEQAKARDFAPVVVVFDSWYGSLDNLKLVRDMGWVWLTRLKNNRQVSLQAGHLQAVADVDVPQTGLQVHLKGYGIVRIFRTIDPDGDVQYWATNRLDMSEDHRRAYAPRANLIEQYHRDLKQFTGVERGQFRLTIAQLNHIGLAIRAYIRLEWQRVKRWSSIFECKMGIIREAVRLYRASPTLILPSTA